MRDRSSLVRYSPSPAVAALVAAAFVACATSESSVRGADATGFAAGGQGGAAGSSGTAGSGGTAGGASGSGSAGLTGISGSTSFGGLGGSGGSGGTGGGAAGTAGTAGTGGMVVVAGAGGDDGGGDDCAAAPIPDKTTWVATGDPYPGAGDAPANAIDASTTTRFATGTKQVGGEWLQVDFGPAGAAFSEVTLFTNNELDYPRVYEIRVSDVSEDDSATPISEGVGSANLIVPFGSVVQGRYLYIKQTGAAEGISWWSVHNLSVDCK